MTGTGPLRIGLTGGIASGKSTVAGFFADLGAAIIDTDLIARELVVPGSPALEEIAGRFGRDMLAPDGTLDRAALRRLVFADASQRRDLEAILHPLIRAEAMSRANASRAPYVLVVVPLLFETGFDALVDRTLVVDCPEHIQLDRLQARDGVSAEEARAIIAAQMDRERRRAAADDIIDNSRDLRATRARVARLHEEYLALARNCSQHQGRAE